MPLFSSVNAQWQLCLYLKANLNMQPPCAKSLNSFHLSWGIDQVANIRWIIEKAREVQKNIYFCFIDYIKAFDCVDHNKLWKILNEMRIPDHLTCLLRNLYAGQKEQLELDMEKYTGSKLEKEYVKAIYCYPVYITYLQSTT